MSQLIKILKIKSAEVLVRAGYIQSKHPMFHSIRTMTLFLIFQFIKLQAGHREFILPLRTVIQNIDSLITTAPFFIMVNILSLLPFGIFMGWIFAEQSGFYKGDALKQSMGKQSAFRTYTVNSYVFFMHTFPMAIYLNLRLFIEGFQFSNIGIILLGVTSSLLITTVVVLFPYNMLLGYWSLPILICCSSAKTNNLFVQILAFAFLIAALKEKPLFKCWHLVEQLLKWLLVPTYLLPIFATSINLENYLMIFFLIAVAAYFDLQQDRLDTLQQRNARMLEIIAKIRLEKTIKKGQEIKLLNLILSSQESFDEDLDSLCYDSNNKLDYPKLCRFYKQKLQNDLQNNPEDDLTRIQLYQFQAYHEPIGLSLIKNVESQKNKLHETLKYKQKIKLHQIQLKIIQAYPHNEEQTNIEGIIDVCTQLQVAHHYLYHNLHNLSLFLNKLEHNEIPAMQIYSLFQTVLQKEGRIIDILGQLSKYPFAKNHIDFLIYSLKLIDFSFQVKSTHSSRRLSEIEEKSMAECYFLMIGDCKITDISSQLLKPLNKWKTELIGCPLQQLIPSQIVGHVYDSYTAILDRQTTSKKIILPLINKQQRIFCFRAELKCMYTISSGLQHMITFYNSNNLKSCLFLYCAQTDQILYVSEQFEQMMHKRTRKFEGQMFSHQLFTLNLSQSILKAQNETTFQCHLVKYSKYEPLISIQLSFLEVFKRKKKTFAIVQAKTAKAPKELPKTRKTIKQFVLDKMQEESHEYSKRIRGSHEHQDQNVTFCKIPNAYESQIYEKIKKLSDFRCSYLKIASIFMVVIMAILLLATVFFRTQLSSLKSSIQTQFNRKIQSCSQIQGIYQLFYQYYQYYHIKSYPHHFLSFKDYNISELAKQYQAKVQSNILTLVQAPPINSSQKYTLLYDGYNSTDKVDQALLQFATAVKEALNSNDPLFIVRNQHNIHIILGSITQNQEGCLQNYQLNKTNLAPYLFAILVAVILVVKCVFLKIQAVSAHVLSVYSSIPPNQISQAIRQYRQVSDLIDCSEDQADESSFTDALEEAELQASRDRKIAEYITSSSLVRNNALLIIVAICVGCWFLINHQFSSYASDSCLVLQKKSDLERSINQVMGSAEKFYNQAMLGLLPPELRINQVFADPNVNLGLYSKDLPSYFDKYIREQQQILSSSICQFSDLNNPYLFGGVYCSLILDGNTRLYFMESYVLYLDLIRNYIGTEINQLGSVYKENAKYPVFMEIAFLRQSLKNIVKLLEKELTKTSQNYFEVEDKRITDFSLILSLATLITAFLVLIYQLIRVSNQCRAVVRCFKLLPKSFLLNVKTTKYLIKENILEQLQKIPF